MIGHRLTIIFESSRPSPSNSEIVVQKWWPICGQSFLYPSKLVLYTLDSWVELATNWPSFLNQNSTVTRARLGGVKNGGQSVANHLKFLLKNHIYIRHCFDGVQIDWPQIGHHFCLKNMLLLGLALEESKMVANLWPIILNSIKAMSYTDVILE